MNIKKNKLVWNAVPTLFAVPNPPKLVTPVRPPPESRKRCRNEMPVKTKRARLDRHSPERQEENPDCAVPSEIELQDTPRKKTLKRRVQKLRTQMTKLKKRQKDKK